jgi:hypothetical protein
MSRAAEQRPADAAGAPAAWAVFAALVQSQGEDLRSEHHLQALHAGDSDVDNVRAAWRWLVATPASRIDQCLTCIPSTICAAG